MVQKLLEKNKKQASCVFNMLTTETTLSNVKKTVFFFQIICREENKYTLACDDIKRCLKHIIYPFLDFPHCSC